MLYRNNLILLECTAYTYNINPFCVTNFPNRKKSFSLIQFELSTSLLLYDNGFFFFECDFPFYSCLRITILYICICVVVQYKCYVCCTYIVYTLIPKSVMFICVLQFAVNTVLATGKEIQGEEQLFPSL